MILYIEHTQFGTHIYQSKHIITQEKNALSVIKEMCISHLFTYDGYLKACKKVFHLTQLVPVYVSEEIMMMPTGRVRDYETIWINLAAVIDAEPFLEKTRLTFNNQATIVINISYNKYLRAKHVLNKIRNTKVKHFHLQ